MTMAASVRLEVVFAPTFLYRCNSSFDLLKCVCMDVVMLALKWYFIITTLDTFFSALSL
jgi:hypothetical protein